MARFGAIPTQLDIPASNFIRRNVGDTAFEAASDVVIDGDFASGGLMKRGTNPGDYSIIGGSSAIDTVEASLTDDATHMATSAAIYAAIATAVSTGVQISGTPSDNRIAVWVSSTAIEASTRFTEVGTSLIFDGYFYPGTDTSWNLGSISARWATLYTNYVNFVDSSTYIGRDGFNNMYFTDINTGGVTLADLMAGPIDISGVPVNNQVVIWADPNTIEGDPGLIWSGTILDTTGTFLVDAIDEHSGGVGITIDGGLLKDNSVGNSSNYWNYAYIAYYLYLKHPSGTTATYFYSDNIDILYIRSGAADVWIDTATYDNRLRISNNSIGSGYYMSIQGSQLEHFVNGSIVNAFRSTGITTLGVLETDDITEVTSSHGVEIEGVIIKDSYIILAEITAPGTPSANTGYLYMDTSDEHIYFKNSSTTYDLTTTGGGAGLAWSGSGNNKVGTYVDADTIQAEDNLQFDGSTLAITGTLTVSAISNTITQERVLFYNSSTGAFSYGPDGGGSTTTFLRADGSWQTPSGSGNVSNTGTPLNDQIAVWTSATVIEGTTGLTYAASVLGITGTFTVSAITAGPAQDKVLFYNSSTGAIKYVDGLGSTANFLRGDGTFAPPPGGGISWATGGSNRVGTYVDANTIQAEANLQFNGTTLYIGGTVQPYTAITGNSITFSGTASDSDIVQSGGKALVIKVATTGVAAKFNPSGSADLYYNNAKKFGTTATGIDVTGRAVVDGLTTSAPIYGTSAVDIGNNSTSCFRHGFFSGSVYSDDSLILNWEGTPQTLNANNDGIYTTSKVGIGGAPNASYNLYVIGSIYATGDVGIGGTNATAKLYVYHNISGEYAAYFNQDHATAHGIRVDIDATSGTTYTLFRGYRSTTKIAELRSDGDWWAADYVLSSDRRLKNVYAYVNDGLDIVMRLNPVNYRWKDKRDDDIHIGFIAQEVQKIRPELVKGGNDDFLSLSYIKMSALAIAGIQGLNRKVDTIEDQLRKEIIDLKLRVKELEYGNSS